MEKVDILSSPAFKKNGVIKTREQALNDGDWIGGFNLWVIQSLPEPAIIYQQRSPKKNLEPGKLDVTAGGHYQEGEEIHDGLREVQEELGKDYDFNNLLNIGRKVYVGKDQNGRERRNIVDVFLIEDNSTLTSYTLQKEEVYAIYICPINELLKLNTIKNYTFIAQGILNTKKKTKVKVSRDSFPVNFDNYHITKMPFLASRFLSGEKNIVY